MEQNPKTKKLELATLGGGCFWCMEAVFKQLKGVVEVLPGYSGGFTAHPSYNEVKKGTTRHAEVVQVKFDPEVLTFRQLLEVFFKTHNPTTPNRQGADIGTQYRSAVFFHDKTQEKVTRTIINSLQEQGFWDNPVVTEVTPLEKFYVAEDYHHNYFENNPNQGYCQVAVAPKVNKARILFANILK